MPSAAAAADFRALGTGVRIVSTEPARLEAAVDAVQRELDAIDLACSRFRDDSELARLNADAGAPHAVGPLLLEAITVALRAADLTGGAVDPTVGRALAALGYDRDFTLVIKSRGAGELLERPAAGWRRVKVDAVLGRVTVPAGVHLDLGSAGKALAADRAAVAAHRAAGAGVGVLVNLGGDIAVAGPPPDAGWPVLVTDDHAASLEAAGQGVVLKAGGLATSSTTVRRWSRGGEALHHILDPATGLPARTPWRTASAVAATCVEANAWATAAIVWGEAAPAQLAAHGVAARLVRSGGEVLKVGDWPQDGERP